MSKQQTTVITYQQQEIEIFQVHYDRFLLHALNRATFMCIGVVYSAPLEETCLNLSSRGLMRIESRNNPDSRIVCCSQDARRQGTLAVLTEIGVEEVMRLVNAGVVGARRRSSDLTLSTRRAM
ncbi:MAG: hypothetical protein AAB649_03320 [Patescibacteria group bacterium]